MESSRGDKKRLIGCIMMAAGGLLVACMGVLWFAYYLYRSTDTIAQVTGVIRAGEKAPDFNLTASAGGEHRLSSYTGKVVLLNFWTTWCGPCESEMPDIERLSTRYSANDLVILGVNCEESAAEVKSYREEHDLTFPLLLDPYGKVADTYHVRNFPTSIVIDREGIIRQVRIGSMGEEQFVEMIEKVIADPPVDE